MPKSSQLVADGAQAPPWRMTSSPVTSPDLAMSLNNLSLRLAEAGRRDEGLAAIQEAVTVYRRLAAANAAAYEPDLAMSLNNLSNRLAEAGRRDEAERARQEAAELERRRKPPGHIF